MSQSLHSPYWYRVAELKPVLAEHIDVYRHYYRTKRWHVLSNSVTGQQHRFNETAYFIIGRMDGKRSIQELWELAAVEFGDESPTQDELIQLLTQLHATESIVCDTPQDLVELFARQERLGKQWQQRFKSPFSLRFPLVDPGRFLDRWLFAVSPLFSVPALLCWVVVVAAGFVLAIANFPELIHNGADRILSPGNLLLIWLCYPFVKLLHEMGHAFVTRFFGGEVHEMGVIILAFTPIPYVEASSSSAFPNKWARMAVAAAGMAVELFIASLALFLWLNVESGLVSALVYNVFLIAGLSTILFNANPLLRFDGYYILSDFIEIPNLAGRANQYLGYVLQKFVLRIDSARSPVSAKGEAGWFFVYGILAFVYRIFILTSLILFISSRFFFAGVLIALWAICSQVLFPFFRVVSGFLNSSVGRRSRKRLFLTTGIPGLSLILAVVFVPLPRHTVTEGVVWVNDQSQVRAGADCFVSRVLVSDNSNVKKDTPLIQCEDPFLEALVAVKEAELKELQTRYRAQPLKEYVKKAVLKEKVALKEADLARTLERRQELILRSPHQGVFILPGYENIEGLYLQQGTPVAYVIDQSSSVVRVAIPQDDVTSILKTTKAIDVRLGDQEIVSVSAVIAHEVPAASYQLPSSVLGTDGGGVIPVSPDDANGLRALKKVFKFEIPVTLPDNRLLLGERVYSRFDHGREPLVKRWYRSVRQLFLRRFNA